MYRNDSGTKIKIMKSVGNSNQKNAIPSLSDNKPWSKSASNA
jgi:hypothetical protein